MLRCVITMVMVGLAGSAWAADLNANGAANPGSPAGQSYAKNDQVLKCLGLTDEQAAKIDTLFKDLQAAQRELYKGMGNNNNGIAAKGPSSKEEQSALQEKANALKSAFDTKVSDLLIADQKAKFEAAQKIQADSQKAIRDLMAKSGSPGSRATTVEDRKALQEAMMKINREREDALAKLLGQAPKKDGAN